MASPALLKRRLPARRRALSMTSLIDVIFLLLLFFMLSTTFTRTAELPLVAGGNGTATAQSAQVFLRLSADTVTVNGQPAQLDQVASRITAVAQEGAQERLQVLVSLAPQVSAQRLADLLVRLRGATGFHVQVLG